MTPITLQIAAGQSGLNTQGGHVLTVKSTTLPVNVSADGGGYESASSGSVLDYGEKGFRMLNFQNPNAVAVTVVFFVGKVEASYSASDSSASNASTYAVGNLGIAKGYGGGGGKPACSASGLLQITSGMGFAVPSVDSATGHRRQTLIFSVDPAAQYNLEIDDPAGNTFIILAKGQQVVLVTDAALTLSGVGGTVGVAIGSVYLNNN